MDNNPKDPAQDDAAAFIPTEQVVHFAGREITVRPLNVLQAIKLSQTLKSVLPALDRMQALLASTDTANAAPGTDELGIVVELLADYGEPLTEGIAIATATPVAVIHQANDIAGLVTLIATVVRVNADFFARQVAPHLGDLRNAAAPGAGLMPSTASSAPATH